MYIGIDIGGTKCAVIKAEINNGGELVIEKKEKFETSSCNVTIEKIMRAVEGMLPCRAIGISCGGPLDEEMGIIKSPPNLPGWDDVHIVDILKERFGVPVAIQNDANACALAEWRFGAGTGTRNMVFLTFGTGLGGGIILIPLLTELLNYNQLSAQYISLIAYIPTGIILIILSAIWLGLNTFLLQV